MKIAIVGAGNVGRTLGTALSAAGHDVVYGVPDPGKHDDLPAGTDIASAVEAATAADGAVLLAVPGNALPDVLATHGPRLDGALLIDLTNSMGGEHLHQLPLLTAAAPKARIARAFCTAGVEVIAEPVINGEQADSVWCGPDGADGAIVEALIRDVGLRPVRVGGLEAAGVVDGVTRLWFALAFGGLGRHSGIRILGERP